MRTLSWYWFEWRQMDLGFRTSVECAYSALIVCVFSKNMFNVKAMRFNDIGRIYSLLSETHNAKSTRIKL